jgi:hypothetical protein
VSDPCTAHYSPPEALSATSELQFAQLLGGEGADELHGAQGQISYDAGMPAT